VSDDMRQQLLERITARRASIDVYLRENRPRSDRLANTAIVSGAVAAVLVSGPALGGETFTSGAADVLAVRASSAVWQVLCFLGMVAAVVAAISTNLHKSQNLAGRISTAEACDAELEGLETMLEFKRLPTEEAVELYQGYITRIPFVDELEPAR
jgi:hypothetical protein